MASVSFYTRSIIKKDSDIVISVLVRDTNTLIRLSTGISIPSDLWDNKKGAIKNYYHHSSDVVSRMNIAKKQTELIRDKIELFIAKNPDIKTSDVKDIVKDTFQDKIANTIPFRMNEYIPFVIEQMKTGERKLPSGGNYAKGTIKSWGVFWKNWQRFQDGYIERNISFGDISVSIYNKLIDYFNEQDFTADTQRKHITTLKAIMNYAYMDKLHTNRDYTLPHFSKQIKTAEGVRVYLTDAETESIYNLKLTDEMLDKVRDLFLIGCYTAQRVSDYASITKDKIVDLKNGYKAFSAYQTKTKHKVTVPFLNGNAVSILNKWNFNLPSMGGIESTATLINRHIKTICRMAGIIEPFTTETMRGGKIIVETKDKCDCVSSHTARRSAITNFFKNGLLDVSDLMFLSGHKTEKAFNGYICLSDNERAERIAEKLEKISNTQNKTIAPL